MGKLTIIDKRFYVNPSKRTCVCTVEYLFNNEYLKFTGKSICHEDEEFDEQKGMHIAESRAKVKAYSMALRTYENAIKEISEFYNDCIDRSEFFEFLLERETNHIDELING